MVFLSLLFVFLVITVGQQVTNTIANRYETQNIEIDGKIIQTTNPNKVPLWKRIQNEETEEIKQKKLALEKIAKEKEEIQKQFDKKVNRQLRKSKKHLDELALFKIKNAEEGKKEVKIEKVNVDKLALDKTTLNFDLPKHYKDAKCKPVVRLVQTSKTEPTRQTVEVDVFEERAKQNNAKRLMRAADDLVRNADLEYNY
ncbi:hypothetical protein EIN_132320 [Entamoeba invadens IP1]|uniref:Uncharacterized protein n=1 Tax=Entamoeba invadens IP1 TaxID=370355 RepID=A0A0A1UH05_ENTIV|nr:hypothetical protein EIN_132320 [Entamoeba invadens IP1]ELP94353.1 hypothetical protein EIN_132320 [Entamoeba invadens IP1]|eukprot:XP_004261124.1 hypothetical protein EIN_132320 [Entamoeba invadens IP1]